MTMLVRRGSLIVVEGIDRSGKSTQCKVIVENLLRKNIPSKLMKFPERSTNIGKMIDDFLTNKVELDDRAIHLLFSANRWELSNNILEELNNGVTLVVDRYAFSGVAYSAAKEGMDLEWCKYPDSGLPNPDAVFFLNISSDKTSHRGGFGDERYEKTEFQKKVFQNFLLLKTNDWIDINAGRSQSEVSDDMMKHVLKTIEKCEYKPVGKLWVDKKAIM